MFEQSNNILNTTIMSNTKLNYYVRIDASGRPVSGSTIQRQNAPKIGRWKRIPTSECCNGISVIVP